MHVFLTGASSGIGEALARAYANAGASLTLVARRGDLLRTLAAETTAKTHIIEADLTDPEAALRALAEGERALGPVDVLVNNAGVQIVADTVAVDWKRAEAMLRLNVFTPLRLTQAVLPGMFARGSGTIVDIASMAAIAPTPGMFHYNASKGALAAASEGLRGEVRGRGVHVVTVYPGPVHTALEKAGRGALETTAALTWAPTGEADVLAKLIMTAVERKEDRVVYPAFYGLARHFPNLTRFLMDRLTPKVKALPPGGGST